MSEHVYTAAELSNVDGAPALWRGHQADLAASLLTWPRRHHIALAIKSDL